MAAFLRLVIVDGSWILLFMATGLILCRLCIPFVSVKQKLPWKVLLVVTFGGTSGMVIWVGDNNLLFTLPVFLGFFFLCTQGLVVLPFVLVTSLVLLRAIRVLADHQQLARTAQLAEMRELYYQGLRREQDQVRTLRHDLRNHLTALQGLLAQGQTAQAAGYLEQIAGSPWAQGSQQFCENETANVVLSSKAEAARRLGLQAEFQAALPRDLPIADPDLCALLGNAIDNAMEAAQKAANKKVRLRCRTDKGLFMLQVENALTGDERPDLSTTKKDKAAHGFGLAGMREIAARYGGSLEAGPREGRFELVVCLPLERNFTI